MAKNKSIKITDEDYNRISSAAYDIQNYHIGEIIYTSNGQKLYVIDYKKQKRALTRSPLLLERIIVIPMKANTLKKSKTPSSHTADQNPSAGANYKTQ
ncbi:hypothetical protein [Bacillus spizizenii]|uniref:hypothetical protein n=1 Tax=Bacillus spizizenii TaxID=96241 RepID=UPI000A7F2046|nr:hypothetical protein [Bacillus spizizenii]